MYLRACLHVIEGILSVYMNAYTFEGNVANMAVSIVFFCRIVVAVVSGVRGNKHLCIGGFCFIYY